MHHLSLWLELRRWRRAGRTARLWWRDDDAAGPSAALDRLLEACRVSAAPLALAVIPAGDKVALAAQLAPEHGVTVIQHGVDHQNRRSGPAAGEFPHDWSQAEVEASLLDGWRLLQVLPRARAVFAPPWNDIHPQLEAALAARGYAGWSANGTLTSDGLPRIDAHLDLLRWRGGARFRGRGRFLKGLTAELARRRRAGAWTTPIGLLTHHLAHDEAAWRFLEDFLSWSKTEAQLSWAALADLLPPGPEKRPANGPNLEAQGLSGLSLVAAY